MSKKKVKSNEHAEFINTWMSEIKKGERYRTKYGNQSTWEEYRKMYRGYWDTGVFPVNKVFSYGKSLIPRIYFRSPRVSITATRPELVPHALIVESIDNWLIKTTKLKKTMKLAALHTYLCGIGPIKLGFDSEFGFLPSQSVDEDGATVTQVARKEEARQIEYNVNVRPGLPWALPVMPEDIIVPWGARDPDDLPWICHRILRPLSDVQQDQKYRFTGELNGTKRASVESGQRNAFHGEGEDLKLCELFEIRDARTGSIYVICEDKLLLTEEDALQINGLNYEFVIFNEDPEYFWPIPDVRILYPQQRELNEIRSQTSDHRKVALLKFLVIKGALAPDAAERFLSGKVGPFIEVDADSVVTAISMLQPHIPPDLSMEASLVMNDMRESMGFSENQMASFARTSGKQPTATETAEVAGSFDMRIDEKKDVMGDVLSNIIRKWNQYIFSFWTKERVAKIVGPQGDTFWVSYTGDQLQGEYDYEVDVDSGFPVTKNVKRKFADGLRATYGGDPLVDPIALRKYHLSQYEDIAPGVSGIVNQQQDPATMMAQENEGGAPKSAPGAAEGNRGGGRKSFGSPQAPLAFEQFKNGMKEGKFNYR